MVNSEEPLFLAVGEEVSAKYKGTFCEAKIKRITKSLKCKVQYGDGTIALVLDELVKGPLKVGATVEVKCNDKKELVEATIKKIQDNSQYFVVFNDGDITCLKRTALYLKSKRDLDTNSKPSLTQSENNVTPIRNVVYGRRNRQHSKSSGKEKDSTDMDKKDFGKVVCVESNDKKKIRDNWFPGLVVAPTAQSAVKTNVEFDKLVRSFKDGKYYTVSKKDISHFTKEIAARVENPTLKTAVEKAILYIDKDELPPHWDRDLLFGVEKNCITTDSEGILDTDNSDEESIEEKDHFVAQLFKFMDDRGTPLNQIPVIHGKDVDLYKMFKVVNTLGGYNKVSKFKQWKTVGSRIGHENSTISIKQAYQTYLHSFEDFYRKLGCTMLSHPRGVRSRSRFSRNIIRDVDKSLPSTLSNEKNKQPIKQETAVKENDVIFKDPMMIRKPTKTMKSEEKLLLKSNDESKRGDKKKDDGNASRNKSSGKCEPEILETNVSKIKKENIKKEYIVKSDNVESKKTERKSYARNLFTKSIRKNTKNEKINKVQTNDTGLSSSRKMRSFKDRLKVVVVNVLNNTPFKKSKRASANVDTLNKTKTDEDVPKLTRSRTKDDVPNRRRISTLSNELEDSCRFFFENPSKSKKIEYGIERKRMIQKRILGKGQKFLLSNINTLTGEREEVTDDEDSPAVNDDLIVYYGDKHATTYDAKVLNKIRVDGILKYYVHYKGWNSRYDEWIDFTRVASKVPETGIDNDAQVEEKPVEPPKLLSPPVTRPRRSITPSTPFNSQSKKPPAYVRPTRTCTLIDRSLPTIVDNSDSEDEYLGRTQVTKQNTKRNQVLKPIKTEHSVTIKTESFESANNQKKMSNPKTYPSKEVLMQRNLPKNQKPSGCKVQSNKNEKSNFDLANVQIKHENCGNLQNEPKVASIHYLSPKEKSEYNNQGVSDSTKNVNARMEIDSGNEFGNSKISGTDFDLNKIRSEMKGLMPTLTTSNLELINNSESFTLNQLVETEVATTLLSEDIYEFKDSDLCDIQDDSSSETKETQHQRLLNDLPKLFEKRVEFPKNIESISQIDFTRKSDEPLLLFESNSNSVNSSDNYVEMDMINVFKDNGTVVNEIEDSIFCSQPENGFSESENLVIIDSIYTNDILENSADEPCHIELGESEMKEEILDFSMKTPEIPPNTIFHMAETNDGVIVEDEDYDDDDETKLIIAEIDKVDSDSIVCGVHHSSNEQVETRQNQALTSEENIHQSPEIKSVYKTSNNKKLETIMPKDMDDENAVSCDESIRNALVQNFKMYSQIENQSYIDNDESAQNGYEYESSLKFPTTDNVESVVELSINESTSNDKVEDYDLSNIQIKEGSEKEYANILPELQCREEIVDDEPSFNNALIIEYNQKSEDYDIHKPSGSKHFFHSAQEPNSNDDYFETGSYNGIKTSFLDEGDINLVKSIIFDNSTKNNYNNVLNTNQNNICDDPVPGPSRSIFSPEPGPSRSIFSPLPDPPRSIFSPVPGPTRSIFSPVPGPTRSIFSPVPSPTRSIFSPVPDNNVLFCEETIPGSPTGLTEEQFDRAQKKILMAQEGIDEEREAASTMFSLNQSYHRSLLTTSIINDAEHELTNIMQNEDMIDQRQLHFLAEVSSRKPGIAIKSENTEHLEPKPKQKPEPKPEPKPETKPEPKPEPKPEIKLEIKPEPIIQQIKSGEKIQLRRKNSNHEHPTSSKRSKAAASNIDHFLKPIIDIKIPTKDGKPLIALTTTMDSQQRQAMILAKINELRKEYGTVKNRLSTIDRRRKKIKKRRREMLKLNTMNQNKHLASNMVK